MLSPLLSSWNRTLFLTLLAASPFVPAAAPAQPVASPPASSAALAAPATAAANNTIVDPVSEVPASYLGHPLRVVVRIYPPFVIQGDDGQLQGFSIDLWNEISHRIKLHTNYQVSASVDDLINQVANGKADVGISAISITAARDVLIDFSQPMYEGGLQIAVRASKPGSDSALAAMWDVLTSSNMLHLIALIFITAIIIAHVVWFVERRHKEAGVLEDKNYIPGIYKAFWWSMGTIGTQVDEMPLTWLGRVIAIFWMFCAIVFVADFTAAATTSLTVKTLTSTIQSPNDLPGKRVATTAGSTGEAYLQSHHAIVTSVPTLDAAIALLTSGKVDAVVSDAPVLQYYAAYPDSGRIQLVGDIFRKENYGIIVANDNPLRIAIDTALLEMQTDGTFDNLVNQWFKPAGGS